MEGAIIVTPPSNYLAQVNGGRTIVLQLMMAGDTGDDGWGRIYGEGSLDHPFKTEGSWDFLRRTLSCNTHIYDYIFTSRLGSVVLIQRIF